MRRFTTYLFAFVITILVPTMAHAASPSLDPNGQPLAIFPSWIDSLGAILLTYLGI